MHAKIHSIAIIGLNCELIEVEADISGGLSSFKIVGLGDTSVQEAKERVRSAIKNSGCTYPIQKKTVNLAPAELRKQGSTFDLPIATAILAASKQIPHQVFRDTVVVGELSLDGNVKPIKGVLPVTNFAKKKGFKRIFLPSINKAEASLIDGIKIYGVESLEQLKNFCQGHINLEPTQTTPLNENQFLSLQKSTDDSIPFASIYGLENAKRALIISAAGNHNVLLRGQPGTGKTVLARAFKNILPPLTLDEAFEVTALYIQSPKASPQTQIS